MELFQAVMFKSFPKMLEDVLLHVMCLRCLLIKIMSVLFLNISQMFVSRERFHSIRRSELQCLVLCTLD